MLGNREKIISVFRVEFHEVFVVMVRPVCPSCFPHCSDRVRRWSSPKHACSVTWSRIAYVVADEVRRRNFLTNSSAKKITPPVIFDHCQHHCFLSSYNSTVTMLTSKAALLIGSAALLQGSSAFVPQMDASRGSMALFGRKPFM